MQRHFSDSGSLCRCVRAQSSETCLLSFSCGKDAVCAWLQLRRHFTRIVPFYLYLIPDLAFVNQAIRYYEDWFGARILQYPHPSLYRMLRNLVFQPPERIKPIQKASFPRLTYEQIEARCRLDAKATDAFVAIGTRSADSPVRLANIRRYGSLNPQRRSFFPVFDWKIADVEREIRAEGLKLPVDYRLFGRSFDGIDYRFLKPIQDHLPSDYAKILAWFPLADLELKRREFAEAHCEQAAP